MANGGFTSRPATRYACGLVRRFEFLNVRFSKNRAYRRFATALSPRIRALNVTLTGAEPVLSGSNGENALVHWNNPKLAAVYLKRGGPIC